MKYLTGFNPGYPLYHSRMAKEELSLQEGTAFPGPLREKCHLVRKKISETS